MRKVSYESIDTLSGISQKQSLNQAVLYVANKVKYYDSTTAFYVLDLFYFTSDMEDLTSVVGMLIFAM